jgi:hypothetical protein
MKPIVIAVAAAAFAASVAWAKLPAPDDAAKAKAAETAAKTKWSTDVANFQLCKVQDRVVDQYRKQMQAQGKAASAPSPTPTQPCTDPGPFAFTPPSQKPIEASGAHSPPGKAGSPPSTPVPQSQSQPTGKKP